MNSMKINFNCFLPDFLIFDLYGKSKGTRAKRISCV